MYNSKINHPSHYNVDGRPECIEEMRLKFGEYITAVFCLTNAFKYLYRAGNKETETLNDDIEKAKWYCSYYIRVLEPLVIKDEHLKRLWNDVMWRFADYD